MYTVYKSGKLLTIRHNCPQTYYIFDTKKRLMCDEIFSLENLTHLFGIELENVNKCENPKNYVLNITNNSYKKIREIYSDDFKLLNYSTDPVLMNDPPLELPYTYTTCIKTFNRPLCLDACLKSIYRNADSRRVVIVDDSTNIDRLKENLLITKKYDLDIKYIEIEKNSGLSKGRNIAVQNAGTKGIFLIDDNIIVPPNVQLNKYIKFILNKNIDIIAFKIYGRYTFTKQKFIDVDIDDETYKITTQKEDNFTVLDNICKNLYKKELTENLFVASKELLLKYPWDERLKLREHLPWFAVLWKNNIIIGESDDIIFKKEYFRYINDKIYSLYRDNVGNSHTSYNIWMKYYKKIK